jgi:hypothetical protein
MYRIPRQLSARELGPGTVLVSYEWGIAWID